MKSSTLFICPPPKKNRCNLRACYRKSSAKYFLIEWAFKADSQEWLNGIFKCYATRRSYSDPIRLECIAGKLKPDLHYRGIAVWYYHAIWKHLTVHLVILVFNQIYVQYKYMWANETRSFNYNIKVKHSV